MFFYHKDYNNMKELCDGLRQQGYIKDDKVFNTMLNVDRRDFCSYNPYRDSPQSINYNVTISAPHMHAYCLNLLKDYLKEGNRALDIGFGSGYLTLAMSKMMGDKGIVVGIEHIPQLCDFAKKNISKNNKQLLDTGKIILIEGDGRNGYSQQAPYNCMHVGAAAENVPNALINQLANGGRLVIPVGGVHEDQYICIIDKDKNGNITKRKELGVRYVPLTSVEKQLKGY